MFKKKILFLLFPFTLFTLKAQETKKGILNIKKIGFLYNYANENNFLFNDKDYSYSTNTYKLQAFYRLGNWKSFDIELIVQPQVQFLEHQLMNMHFVTPAANNYQEKRSEFTRLKKMYLYAFELGFVLKRKIIKQLEMQVTIGLGIATIDTRSERMAKGFTFIENGSLGCSYQTSKKTFLYIGTNIGHVSNLNFKSPNSGFNILGYEIGISYSLK